MNFAFLIQSKAAQTLCSGALKLLSTRRTQAVVLRNSVTSPVRAATAMPTAVSRARPRAAVRPLRVVRVIERGQSRSDVGRMVISGRMADVCDELDRLAAREAAEIGLMGRSVAVGC